MNHVKQYRLSRGLSQKELAILAGLKHQTIISDIELGKRNPKYKTMRSISSVLDRNVEILFPL